MNDLIIKEAGAIRKWVERHAGYIKPSDAGYIPPLTGYCAIASAKLFDRLTINGLKPSLALSTTYALGDHVFLKYDDHIIDVTATQFREFRNITINILHERIAIGYEYYSPDIEFNTPKALRAYQIKNDWPRNQIVLN